MKATTHFSKLLSLAVCLALLLSFLPAQTHFVQAAPIPITLNSTYTQNFDSLANSGTPAWANDSTLPGWYLGTDTNPTVATYNVGTGSGTAGAFYSFGSSLSTDRALGGLGSNTYYGASGVGKGYMGLVLQNQTGANISALSVAYTGEQWRSGGNTTIQSLTFSYVISSSLPTLTASGTAFPALDFASPIHVTSSGALDGNAAANRTALSATITGIIIPDGSYVLLRWTDLNDSGTDHGLAIDDLTVTASTLPIDAAPYVASTVPANGATDVPVNSSVVVNFSEPVNVVDPWFSLSCATSGVHTATVTGGPTTFTLDPGADFVKGEACTLTVFAAKVTDQDLNDPPDNMTIDFTAGYTTVFPPLPIGTVNGPVPDSDSCADHVSPYNGGTVTVQGVIFEKTLQATAYSSTYKGFYLQSTADTTDGEANTSDGLFVYMGTGSKIGTYTPTVGDEIILKGKVSEYYNMTELVSPFTVMSVVRNGVVIDDEVPAVEANPPVSLADANCYWERLQGMRVQVPQNSLVLGGRNVFSPADAEIWVARSDSTIAQRSDPYARKAYRDAHPLDDNYDPTNWDGNGYRILMGSLGIKALEGNNAQTLIDAARSYSTVTNAPAGGLNYTFSKYRIEITEQPTFNEGVDPAQNNPPSVFDRSTQFSIVDYNLENLYDFRDNPFSGCDFTGDSGCPKVAPFLAAVKPPYDYVPADDAAYQARLNDIALEIVNDLHSPDILMVQEVENQDICSVSGTALDCDTTVGNPDGKPDVLQELALKIAANGGPAYDAAYDPNSSDLRGIAPAFLYRTDRVELPSPVGDPVLGATSAINGYTSVPYDSDVSNPKTLNAVYTGEEPCETSWVFPRAPDVALFRIHNNSVTDGSYRDVYVINNHFKSTPNDCVEHRTEQANYNAALVAFIQAANPNARIVVGGDLNVYPRPDDPFAPIGQSGSSDQLGSLYDPALGLKNLWEVLLDQAPESAYSYIYLGQAQTLDQMFVNQALLADLNQFRIAHINSDFPADYAGDVARGTSDHDPNVASFTIPYWAGFFQPVDNLPELNVAKAGSAIPVKFSLGGDQGLNIFAAGYPISKPIACDISGPQDNIEQTVTAGSSSLAYDPLTGLYTYVWKTEKAWAGTCRQLQVTLTDGTTHVANFKFNK